MSPVTSVLVWHEEWARLVAANIDALNQKVAHLEQPVTDLCLQAEERDEGLPALAANRELRARLNVTSRSVPGGNSLDLRCLKSMRWGRPSSCSVRVDAH